VWACTSFFHHRMWGKDGCWGLGWGPRGRGSGGSPLRVGVGLGWEGAATMLGARVSVRASAHRPPAKQGGVVGLLLGLGLGWG